MTSTATGILRLGGLESSSFSNAALTDQLYIHGTTIPVSQVLAIVLVIFSVVCGVVVRICLKKKEETKKNFVGEDQT